MTRITRPPFESQLSREPDVRRFVGLRPGDIRPRRHETAPPVFVAALDDHGPAVATNNRSYLVRGSSRDQRPSGSVFEPFVA